MKPEEQLAEEIKNIIKAKIKDEILNDPLGKPYCQIDVDILLEETAKETIRSRDAEWFSEDVKAEAIPKKKGDVNMKNDFCPKSNKENHGHFINPKTSKCYWCGKEMGMCQRKVNGITK